MNMSPKAILISIAAGLASALCVMASYGVGAGASPLILLAAFPIYVATLSQGTAVGVGSSILAIMVAATAISPQAGIFLGAVFTIPASIIGNQANLAQDDNGEMEWFPLPRLFFNLCIVVSLGLGLIIFLSGYDTEILAAGMLATIQTALEANPRPQPINADELKQFIEFTVSILPFILSGIILIVHILSIHLAASVCRASNMMPRPKDDIALTTNLPKLAIMLMLISLVLSMMLSGLPQAIIMLFAGTFIMAFSLIGLASLHLKLRNNPAGSVFLIILYVIIFITYPLFYLLSISGIFKSFNQSTNQTNTPPNAG